jgi:opacity protein-like surface antigen
MGRSDGADRHVWDAGHSVGVGYEYAFLGNWSAKIEFDYLGSGEKRITW